MDQLESRAMLSAVAWDGNTDGDGDGVSWSDPLNWNTDAKPVAGDDVTINFGTVNVNESSLMDSLTVIDATLNFQSDSTLSASTISLTNTNVSSVSGSNITFDASESLSFAGGSISSSNGDVSLTGNASGAAPVADVGLSFRGTINATGAADVSIVGQGNQAGVEVGFGSVIDVGTGALTMNGKSLGASPDSIGFSTSLLTISYSGSTSEAITIDGESEFGTPVFMSRASITPTTNSPPRVIDISGTRGAGNTSPFDVDLYEDYESNVFEGLPTISGQRIRTHTGNFFEVHIDASTSPLFVAEEVVTETRANYSGENSLGGIQLPPISPPQATDSITLVEVSGSEVVEGRFEWHNGNWRETLDENDVLYTDGTWWTISYVGGDGNDVVITPAHMVTTSANDGPGSLRAAMEAAALTPGADAILFQNPDPIYVTSPLPDIGPGSVRIDGTYYRTQFDSSSSRRIEIVGDRSLAADGSPFSGLNVTGGRLYTSNIAVSNFSGHGIAIGDADYVELYYSRVAGNGGSGIFVDEGAKQVVVNDVDSGVAADEESAQPNEGYGIHVIRTDASPDDHDSMENSFRLTESLLSGNLSGGLLIDDQRTTATDSGFRFEITSTGFGALGRLYYALDDHPLPNQNFGAKLVSNADFNPEDERTVGYLGSVTFSGNHGPGLIMDGVSGTSINGAGFGVNVSDGSLDGMSQSIAAAPHTIGLLLRNVDNLYLAEDEPDHNQGGE